MGQAGNGNLASPLVAPGWKECNSNSGSVVIHNDKQWLGVRDCRARKRLVLTEFALAELASAGFALV